MRRGDADDDEEMRWYLWLRQSDDANGYKVSRRSVLIERVKCC